MKHKGKMYIYMYSNSHFPGASINYSVSMLRNQQIHVRLIQGCVCGVYGICFCAREWDSLDGGCSLRALQLRATPASSTSTGCIPPSRWTQKTRSQSLRSRRCPSTTARKCTQEVHLHVQQQINHFLPIQVCCQRMVSCPPFIPSMTSTQSLFLFQY